MFISVYYYLRKCRLVNALSDGQAEFYTAWCILVSRATMLSRVICAMFLYIKPSRAILSVDITPVVVS